MSWDQLGIALFGVTAVTLTQIGNKKLARWACIIGMISQPFWLYATHSAEQWGMFFVCILYTIAWGIGIFKQWVNPWLEGVDPNHDAVAFELDLKTRELAQKERLWLEATQTIQELRENFVFTVDGVKYDLSTLSGLELAEEHVSEIIKSWKKAETALNTPINDNFLDGLEREVAYQVERWGPKDARKRDSDWMWLIGFLVSKAMNTPEENKDKKLHRLIAAAAAIYNWHTHECKATQKIINGANK